MGLPIAIVARKGAAITAAALAKEVGASAVLVGIATFQLGTFLLVLIYLARIMRVLVALAVVDEVGEEEYKSNPLTEELASPSFTGGTRYV
jgi:hypothetical protein